MKSLNFETGLTDCHKLVCSILRASFKKLPPKVVKYRDQKHFDQKTFLHDLDSILLLQRDVYKNSDEPYGKLYEVFNDILNHHVPLKEKQIRGNHATFMTEELSKAITEKLKNRNKYLKCLSRNVSYKSLRNSLKKKQRKSFSRKLQKIRLCQKRFWSTFLTNRGSISDDFISGEKGGDLISNKKELVGLFNQNYINIVENSSGTKPLLQLKKLYQHIVRLYQYI